MFVRWNPGWIASILVAFSAISSLLLMVVRRKLRLAEIRRMEVRRLVRLAAAESERAEKEAAEVALEVVAEKSFSAFDAAVAGILTCAVCNNPTTNRCSRCKAVKYCSGTCQITHWRQGHKYECHPPLIVDHNKGQPIISDLKGVQTERTEVCGNGLGIEAKGHVSNDGFSIAQRSDFEVKPNDMKCKPNVSDLKGVQDERPEISGNGLGVEGKGHAPNDGFYVDQSVSNAVAKSRPNVSDLKVVFDERPEVNENGLGIEGKDRVSNDVFYVDQSVSNVAEAQSEPSVLVFSRPVIEAKPNNCKRSVTFSAVPMVSSESNIYSKIHGENEEDGAKHFISKKKASLIDPLSSRCSTISGPLEMPDNAYCSDDHTRVAPGQHANANAHDRLVAFSPSSFPDRHKTSAVDTGQLNLGTSPYATTVADSLSYVSLSSELQPHLTHVNDESEFKLSDPKNMKSPSLVKSTDARISKNAREFIPMSSVFVNHDESKTSKISKSYCEGQEETLNLTSSETITCADSTESKSCRDIHLQVDSGLHFELDVKLSSSKSCSVSANQGRSDFRETVSLVVENSGQVAKESNTEQLKSSSPSFPKDHLASIGHSKSFLRNLSPKVENILPVDDKSVKVDGSLTNGKTSSRKAAQLITPSSSLSRHAQHGKYNYKMLFSYDNFIKLYNSDKVAMHPCGLENCGNSCYANVVLQCLAFTRPLAAFILEGLHAKACTKLGWCFTCEFETLLIMVKQGKSPLSPNGIISHIQDIGSNFGHGREEDAHEFLRYSIDALQSACLKEAGANNVSDLAEETTLIQLIFGGYLRSKIKCMRCKGKSERRERMMDLTIDIHGEIGTLEEALARFTASEILDGDNKYNCGRCRSFERAKKQLTILEAPNVLTIALKRYQSGEYGKLNRMVRFSEYLDLAPYMRGSDDNSPVYRLYAVVVHSGHGNAAFSGHYVCYVKNTQGKWFKADDCLVKQVDLQKVVSQGAYMLLYARCSPRAPSLLRKEMAKKLKSSKLGEIPNSSSMFLHLERYRRPSKIDSSSDVSSLFSCSDEGSSWSTESTKDSTASDDLTDYSFSPRRVSVSSDASSGDSKMVDRDGENGGEGGGCQFQGGGDSLRFLYSIKDYRKLTEQVSSRSKSNVLFRRTGGDRPAQTFY